MFVPYLLLIISAALGAANNVCLMKRDQTTAGTGLSASVLLIIINGIFSALVAVPVLLFSHEPFEATPYSLAMALVTVLCAAVSTLSMLKAYESGQIAIANIFSVMGSILLSCLWGIVFLEEIITLRQLAAIFLIVAAILLFTVKFGGRPPNIGISVRQWRAWMCKREKRPAESSAPDAGKDLAGKRHTHIFLLYALIFLCSGFVNIFSKLHQIETVHPAVNTLSFSIWIGVIRTLVFVLFLPFMKRKSHGLPQVSKAAYGYAIAISLVGGGCYIIALTIAAILPLTITTPLSMGISMGLTSFLPWLLYKEKLGRQEIAGILLSIIGILLYT